MNLVARDCYKINGRNALAVIDMKITINSPSADLKKEVSRPVYRASVVINGKVMMNQS